MSYPGRVRIATSADEDEAMELSRQLHQENGIFALNEDKVLMMLRRAFNREGGILGVIGPKGGIEGMIYMLVSTFWYSDDPHLEELYNYVVPRYRKTKAATELIDFAKWCADQSGLPLLIGVISNERTEGKVRLYQRQLNKPIGNFFLYGKKSAKVA